MTIIVILHYASSFPIAYTEGCSTTSSVIGLAQVDYLLRPICVYSTSITWTLFVVRSTSGTDCVYSTSGKKRY